VPAELEATFRWKYEFPAGALSNGTFVDLAQHCVLWQAFGHGIRAVSLDGSTAWTRPAEDSTPFYIRDDRVFVGGDAALSLDVGSGTVRASRKCESDVDVYRPVSGCALFREYGPGLAGRYLGLDPDGLTTRWIVPDPEGRIAWLGDRYYEYDRQTSQVTVHSPAEPSPLGRFAIDFGIWYHSPLVAGDVLVFRTPDRTCAIDAVEGRTLWSAPSLGDTRWGLDRVADGAVYQFSRTLSAVDPSTGRERWRFGAEAEPNDVAMAPQCVWISTRNRRLRPLDPRSGAVTAMPIAIGADVLRMWALSDDELLLLVLLGDRAEQYEALWRLVLSPA
jgi:outer membrane protein assembly factor BamB